MMGVYYQFEVNANPFRARKLFLRAIQLNGNLKVGCMMKLVLIFGVV